MVVVGERRYFGNWRMRQIYNIEMMANYERMTQLLERMQHPQYIRMVEEELDTLNEDPLVVNLLAMALRDPLLPRTSPHTQVTPNSQPPPPSIAFSSSTFIPMKNPRSSTCSSTSSSTSQSISSSNAP